MEISLSYYQKVRQFMELMDQNPIPSSPVVRNMETRILRWRLITEEYRELYDEMWLDGLTEDNLANFAKEMADLIYVVVGTAVAFGIDMDAIFDEVHRSNMSKYPVTYREDGKILKGPNYLPPDIKAVLKRLAIDGE